MNFDEIRFDEHGLVAAVVQDVQTSEVLTLAYMNEESLRRTIETGETWFWSRSRAQLWHKGETSGNTQRVVSVTVDCDGEMSCFHNLIHQDSKAIGQRRNGSIGEVLNELYSVIESRKRVLPEGSYTAYLFKQGLDKILKKLGEESSETIIAAKNEDRDALVRESCDLLYHLLVLLAEREVSLAEVRDELSRRSSVSP